MPPRPYNAWLCWGSESLDNLQSLCLNSSKTELICLGASRYVQLCPTGLLNIAGVSIKPSQLVHDSGVALDSELSLTAHVIFITSVWYFHIQWQLHSASQVSFSRSSSCTRSFQPWLLQCCSCQHPAVIDGSSSVSSLLGCSYSTEVST